MSRINRPPNGLQQLLGSQNFGDNPNELEKSVQPTLDMFGFYGAGLLRQENAGVIQAAPAGPVTGFEFKQYSAIVSASFHIDQTSGGSGNVALGIGLTEVAGEYPNEHNLIVATNPSNYINNSYPTAAVKFDRPLIVEPGIWIFGHLLYAGLTGAQDFRLNVLYYDLSPDLA